MIAHLRGQVIARSEGAVVVDVGGVGYLVHVPDLSAVPARGQPVDLHTSLQVREDAMELYGFPDREGQELFELLLTASGIGPKLALAALRTLSAQALRSAISAGDLAALSTVSGVGRKTAQRIVLELKDKLGAVGEVVDLTGGSGSATSPLAEVREALTALGYSAAEVHGAVTEIDTDGDPEISELVRRALQVLGSGRGT